MKIGLQLSLKVKVSLKVLPFTIFNFYLEFLQSQIEYFTTNIQIKTKVAAVKKYKIIDMLSLTIVFLVSFILLYLNNKDIKD